MLYVNGKPAGGGGGDTGGHTIIDENGNSMTARAGLQFVGGANVSDDDTDDKTIVDLASAGGIDGVFADFNNVIVAQTNVPSSDIASWSYTATEDCVIYISIQNESSKSAQVRIDGKNVAQASGSYAYRETTFTALKKGQVVTVAGNVNPGTNTQYAVYGIQTGTTHSKFQPVIYSTEEREIGVWTDGKPLYEKTITNVSITSGIQWIDLDISTSVIDSDDIKSISGAIHQNNGLTTILPSADSSAQIGLNVFSDTVVSGKWAVLFRTDNTDARGTADITLRYTKSTDTAGSGSWTPQGVPTHHYSTDEQVVGKWIDGSTLYEKTITIQKSSISSGNNIINHLINNFGQLVKKEIIYNYSNGDMNTDLANPTNNDYRMEVSDVGSTDFTLFIGTSAFGLISVIYVTLRYTKSS